MKGFVPGEGRFVAHPEGENEDDGVLLHQWMPLTTDDKPLLTILNAKDLSLIAELEFPMSFLPVGIHGMIFPEIIDEDIHSNPQCPSQNGMFIMGWFRDPLSIIARTRTRRTD